MKRFLAVGGVVLALGLVLWAALPRGDRPDEPHGGDRGRTASREGRMLRWAGGAGEGDGAASEPAPDDEGSEIAGRVLDAIDGRPIPGATVSLRSSRGEELDQTSSDEDGQFLFPPAARASVVAASAPGYALQAKPLRSGTALVLELDGAVAVSGVVVDPGGEPVVGAEVWVEDQERQWIRPPAVSQSVTTDAEGRFVVEDAPMGTLVVHATHARFSPGEAEIGTAGPGRQKSGVRVVLGEAGILRGAVRDADGSPVAGARVEWRADRERGWGRDEPSTRTDADGGFELTGVPPGDGEVYARAEDRGDAAQDTIVEPGRTTEVELTLVRAEPVSGTVLGADGAPVEGARVRRLAWGSGRGARDAEVAVTGADGRFTLELPWRGGSTLIAESGAARGQVRVRPGQTDVEIRLEGAGILRFRLVRADGAPFRGNAAIRAVHASTEEWCTLERFDPSTGEGVISGPPGEWRILVPFVDADFEPAGDVVVSVPAAPPETAADVRVDAVEREADGRVNGRLVGPDGTPVPGARISLARTRGRGDAAGRRLDWRSAVRSDASGRFTVAGPAGAARLFVYHPEFRTELVNVQVPDGGEWDAGTIRLVPGAGSSAIFEFSGIGAVLGVDDANRCLIREVIAGAPAESAGIRAGDVVLEIDGVATQGLTLGDIVERIRGPVGSSVRLRLERPGNLEPFDVDVVRDQIRT